MGVSKKKSGAQRRAWERFINNRAPAFRGILGKQGRPKGQTVRRGKVELDVCWLIMSGGLNEDWTDLKIVSELLQDDSVRWRKYKLGPCEYREVREPTLRRYITAARNKY
jgi:hypothetical protein